MKNAAAILMHPTFDRPKVVNPVFSGKKRGCISLGTARRKSHATRFSSSENAGGNATTGQSNSRTACAQLQQFETLLRTANEEGARCMLMFLDACLETEINRRINEGSNHGK